MPSTSRSQQDLSPGYTQQHVSPLTPPERYDLQGYQEYPLAQPAPRAPAQHYPDAPVPLQLSFDGGLPQLWDMDGAPASPPPLADLNMFIPQQPPPSQRFTPTPVLKPSVPVPAPVFPHPQQHQHPHPYAMPHISVSHARHAAEQAHRVSHHEPRVPHIARSMQPSYHAQGYGAGPAQAPLAEYCPTFFKRDDVPLDERECLRLRLLEEAYHQRQFVGGQRSGSGNPDFGGGPPPNAGRHPSGQWVHGAQRCVSYVFAGVGRC
ncbi:hypothetical protein BD413DRAFT_78261 [Trametes elegans]|nr:hypothetical protein BD413DRAFT_78261 [Trametes elegans]